jgi:transcriptional regulator with XRE-family HTH domain
LIAYRVPLAGVRILATAVSDVLRGIASKRRVDQVELARRTGFRQAKISRLLNGKIVMSIDEADILAHGLGVDLRDVLTEAMADTPDRPRRSSTPDERLRSI